MSEVSCVEVLEEIELYLDGELAPERAAVLARHLEYCTPCIARADFQGKLRAMLKVKCRSEPPADLADRLRKVLRAQQQNPLV